MFSELNVGQFQIRADWTEFGRRELEFAEKLLVATRVATDVCTFTRIFCSRCYAECSVMRNFCLFDLLLGTVWYVLKFHNNSNNFNIVGTYVFFQ